MKNTPNPCRETAGEAHIPGYGSAFLPFSSDPAAFLGEALKALHGVLHHYQWRSPRLVFDFTGLGGGRESLSLDGGLAYIVAGPGAGASAVIIAAALSQQGRGASVGHVSISHDAHRPAGEGAISPMEPGHVKDKFRVFADSTYSPYFLMEYEKDPISIYRRHLEHFLPMRQTLELNTRVEVAKFPGLTLVNRRPIRLSSSPITEFPSRNARWTAAENIELVDEKNIDGPALAVIKDYSATATYRRDLSSPAFVPAGKEDQ